MKESLLISLSKIAMLKSVPYCYRCQKVSRTGVCTGCQSDDLMRFMDGVGVDYGFEWIVDFILESSLEKIDLNEEFVSYLEEVYSETSSVGEVVIDTIRILKECAPLDYDLAKSEWVNMRV